MSAGKISVEKQGRRIYFAGDTFPARAAIKSLGGAWDADYGGRGAWWVGSGKEAAARELVERVNAGGVKEDPREIRLTGKGEYKGRTYFLGSTTADGKRVRCLTLPDDAGNYLDFWADADQVVRVKTYAPRESGFGKFRRRQWTTLGSVAAFVRDQKGRQAAGQPACAACGKRGPLHHDLEDGLMKCYGCCDIPE